jgi:hypothetical protein
MTHLGALKVTELPITCDTLLLTLSPHHHVVHRHATHPEQLHALLLPYQHTHRIVLLLAHVHEACSVLEAIALSEAKLQLPAPTSL